MDREARNYEPTTASFEEFFRTQYPRVVKAMYLLTSSKHEAEEMTQEAMARVLERWERIAVMDSPEGYVYRVAMNLFLRRSKERARTQPIIEGLDVSDMGSQAADALRRLEIRAALGRITPDQRAAVVLVNLAGFSVDEAAEILEIEPVSVRARIHRARSTLRAEEGTW